MPPCAFFYVLVGEFFSRLISFWSPVVAPWRACTAQRCRWWCLCCNKWLCWIILIVVAIVLAVLWFVLFVVSLLLVPICWGTCLILVVLAAIGRLPVPNCFAGAPAPVPGGPPPAPPTVSITQPAAQASLPDGDTVPITFTATALDPDGSALTGAAVRWEEDLVTVPATYQLLGIGTQIAVTLPHRPIDVSANLPSNYHIMVTATGTNGRTASDEVSITVGRVQIT